MKRARLVTLAAALALVACSSKGAPSGSTSGATTSEPDASEAEETAPRPPPARKKLRGEWGTIEVDGAFRAGASMIPLPEGMTADVEYVRYSDGGTALARLVIVHREVPGLGMTLPPKIEDAGGELLAGVVCPGGSLPTGQILIADGQAANMACTRSKFGPGIVATARKKLRLYELICSDESDPLACIEILKTFSPAAP